MKLRKAILKSSYRVLKVACKWKTKKNCLLLRAVEFWPTFNIKIGITLALFGKKLQNYTF